MSHLIIVSIRRACCHIHKRINNFPDLFLALTGDSDQPKVIGEADKTIDDTLPQDVNVLFPVSDSAIQVQNQYGHHPPVLRGGTLLGKEHPLAPHERLFGLSEHSRGVHMSESFGNLLVSLMLAVLFAE